MSGNDLVRAWKDPEERGDVSHPAGEVSLDELHGGFAGSFETFNVGTYGCCNDTFVLCSFFKPACPPEPDPFPFPVGPFGAR